MRFILRADARDFWPPRGLNALFGRRIAIFPMAYTSDKCTTRRCGQTASISVLLISGILDRPQLSLHLVGPSAPTKIYNGTQIFRTTGECVGGLLFPRQRVLPSSCAATVSDGNVVSTQAAL